MNLTDDDVHELLRLLDQIPLDEFDLTTERFRLRLRRSPGDGWTQTRQTIAPPRPLPDPQQAAPATADPPSAETADADAVDLEGRFAIRAPLPGTFYRAPRPGAEPYVDLGDVVDEDTVVGIVETMKLMNSVHAGTRGTVVEVRKANGASTDEHEILMVVAPDEP